MLVSLFSKGYRVIFLTFLFDLFLFYAKIETICKEGDWDELLIISSRLQY